MSFNTQLGFLPSSALAKSKVKIGWEVVLALTSLIIKIYAKYDMFANKTDKFGNPAAKLSNYNKKLVRGKTCEGKI